MSHSSGITISQSLHEEWKKSSNQLLQIIISNEELVLQTKVNNDLQTEEWNFNQMKLIANPKEGI